MSDQDLFVPLADVVDGIRQELLNAKAQKNDSISLIVEDIEVELTTVVTKEAKGGVKLKVPFWDTGVDAGGNYKSAMTQKIKLKIKAEESTPLSEQLVKEENEKTVTKRTLALSD